MKEISSIPAPGLSRKRVVIVGGGFAGLKLARKLRDRHYQIVLLDANNHHIFQPLLYQVATSGIEPSAISFPFRKIFKNRRDFHIRMCRAQRVFPAEKRLETSIGSIRYDYLVIATGCGTNFFGNAALEGDTLQLKTTAQALFNRNTLIDSLEQALNTPDEAKRRSLMTFVVVGGGATGIEMAGALAEMRKFVLPRDYPDLDVQQMKIVLVDASPRLLGNFSEASSTYARAQLAGHGVEIRQNCAVKQYENGLLLLGDGSTLATDNVFWVAGVKPNSLAGLPEEAYGRGGRLLVDDFNRVAGCEAVFALGDTALMAAPGYPNGHPQVVQPAIQQARNLAVNLRRLDAGQALRPFRYRNRGSMATIGRNHAVLEVGSFRMHGFWAWTIWLFIHLMSIVGVKNRVVIFLDWMWSYLTYDQSLRLLIRPVCRKNGVPRRDSGAE